jgi:hypothetical protein
MFDSENLLRYEKFLEQICSMSGLYSDSKNPYVNSRFIEKLFVYISGAQDFSRNDMSFDAKTPDGSGIGIKTFVVNSFTSQKQEKIAEFGALAAIGEFQGLSEIQIARRVSEYRNARIDSDCRIYDINLEKSYYHCLVRASSSFMIHEEPYIKISEKNIKLLPIKSSPHRHIHFTDNFKTYSFNISKNTLFMQFDVSKGMNSIPKNVDVIDNVFESYLEKNLIGDFSFLLSKKKSKENIMDMSHAKNFIILPLYSTRNHKVPERSGLNQWNASGRERTFGEAYIPIPKEVREKFPNFLPRAEVPFKLRIPNGRVLNVKVCQADGKALMSNPNRDLCEWLFSLIDNSEWTSRKRLIQRNPYTYEDLVRIGQDSVRIEKPQRESDIYELHPMNIGSYEDFLEQTVP